MDSKQFLSDVVVYSKYAKHNTSIQRRENWSEIIQRNADMHARRYPQLADEIYKVYAEFVIPKKVFPSMRSLQFAGKAIEVTPNRIFNCLSVDTKFITENGTKTFEDFSNGDIISVPTHTGEMKSATVKSYGEQQLFNITLQRGSRTVKTVKATRNHRWYLNDGSVTDDLQVGDKLIKTPTLMDFDYYNSTPLERLYWAYGYVFGDGSVLRGKDGSPKYSMVRLCDKDRHFSERFEELGFKISQPLSASGDFFAYTGSYKKTPIDLVNESVDNIKAFVAGYMDADAYKNPDWYENNSLSKYKAIQASDNEHIKFIKDASEIAGVYILSEKDLTGEVTNYGTRPTTSKFGISTVIGSNNMHLWTVKSIEPLNSETVWCLEVEDDHSFILSGGVVTGNCAFGAATHPAIFSETMFNLLGGCGVGYSVQRHHVEQLPPIRKPSNKRHKRYLVPDSIEGWSEAIKVLMKSYFKGSSRVVFDYSDIRPKGTELVTAGGKAPGPAPLKECIDVISEKLDSLIEKNGGITYFTPIEVHDVICFISDAVLAGGIRRSALIALFSLEDEEMLTCKGNFKFETTMAPVINGKTVILEGSYKGVRKELYIDIEQYETYCVTGTLPWYMFEAQRGRANNSVVLEYDKVTREMFDAVWERVQDSGAGEPGIYWTNDRDLGSNPCCFTGGNRVLTTEGYLRFDELSKYFENGDNPDVKFINRFGDIVGGKVWHNGNKKVMEIKAGNTKQPFKITATNDHRFMTAEGETVEARNLIGKRLMPFCDQRTIDKDSLSLKYGFIFGDGTFRSDSEQFKNVECSFTPINDDEVKSLFNGTGWSDNGTTFTVDVSYSELQNYGIDTSLPSYDRTLPSNIDSDFLSGLYSANGCVINKHRVSYKTTSSKLRDDILKCLNDIGITDAYYTTNKAKPIKWDNGEYISKESYDINIASLKSIIMFAESINFIQSYKRKALDDLILLKAPYVFSVKTLKDSDDVYDFALYDDTHWGVVEGVVAHNCEISLKSEGYCNLTEVVADGIETQEDYNARAKAAAFLGTLQAGYTNFHYLRPEWQENAEEEALLGVSMTGIASGAVLKLDMVEAAKCAADENARVAPLIGLNKAKRVTTVKPSGCLLPETEIKTNKGIMTIQEIFDMNDIDIDTEHLGFFKVKEDIKIYDENDDEQPITSLYVNGKSETYTIDFEDGNSFTGTGNHKLKTSNRGWVRFDELTEKDDIISF